MLVQAKRAQVINYHIADYFDTARNSFLSMWSLPGLQFIRIYVRFILIILIL